MLERQPGMAQITKVRFLTTVSTEHVDFARSLRADTVIDYRTQRFEDIAKDLDLVFDLFDGETPERSWGAAPKRWSPDLDADRAIAGPCDPGVTAMRYTVEPDGEELAEIGRLADAGKLKPHIQATFPLAQAAEALAIIERGHTAGKVVLTCD